MAEFKLEPPFVAVPTNTPESEVRAISECFPSSTKVQVFHGDLLPMVLYAPAGPAPAPEFIGWIVEFGPDLIMQITQWALLTYFGKKLINGFATKAGEDLWKGVKALGMWLHKRIRGSETKKPQEPTVLNLTVRGAPDNHRPFYLVTILLRVPPEESRLLKTYDDVERFLFPFIGCVSEKTNAVRLYIEPTEGGIYPWEISVFQTNTVYGIDLEQREFKNLVLSNQRDETVEKCLQAIGLQEGKRRPDRRLH